MEKSYHCKRCEASIRVLPCETCNGCGLTWQGDESGEWHVRCQTCLGMGAMEALDSIPYGNCARCKDEKASLLVRNKELLASRADSDPVSRMQLVLFPGGLSPLEEEHCKEKHQTPKTVVIGGGGGGGGVRYRKEPRYEAYISIEKAALMSRLLLEAKANQGLK